MMWKGQAVTNGGLNVSNGNFLKTDVYCIGVEKSFELASDFDFFFT